MATSKKTATKTASKGGAKVDDPNDGDPREGLTDAPAKKPIHMNTVGPKRKLAYALVGILALISKISDRAEQVEAGVEGATPMTRAEIEVDPNYMEARKSLTETGYDSLKPRAEREAELKKLLSEAADTGDAKEVMRLAKVLKAVQDGRPEPGQAKDAGEDDEQDETGGDAS